MENTTVTTAVEAAIETVENGIGAIDINPANFVDNLGYMATGMVGIFVVIGVIIAATSIMNKIFSKNK